MKKTIIFLICSVFVLSGCSSIPSLNQEKTSLDNLEKPAVCTEELKICSDGSSVGRTEVNCEFAACPAVESQTEEKTTPSSESKVYENKYMKFSLSNGWTATLGADASAVNIMKDKYILYINTQAQQASGVDGGRFSEIAMGAPSADAVITMHPSGPCGSEETFPVSAGQKRIDLYVDNMEKRDWCASPANGTSVWYFSYITGSTGGYFNYYKEGEPLSFVITMAYNSKDVNTLPVKGSATLKARLDEMAAIVKTLGIKQEQASAVSDETANWKTLTSYAAQLKYPSNYIYHDNGDKLQWSGSFLFDNLSNVSYQAIEISDSRFSNTNLGQAYIAFSATDKIKGEAECKQYNYQGPIVMTKQIKIGNKDFFTHDHSGAAAGTYSLGDIYRIFYKGVCYELNTWEFGSVISPDHGNAKLKEYDSKLLEADFNSIISTFSFTE